MSVISFSFSESSIIPSSFLFPSNSSTSFSFVLSLRLHRMLLKNPLRPLPLLTSPAPPLSLDLKLPRRSREKKLSDLLRDLTGPASKLASPSLCPSASLLELISPSQVLLLMISADVTELFPFKEFPLSEFVLFVLPLFRKEKKPAIPEPVRRFPKSLNAALLIFPVDCGSH